MFYDHFSARSLLAKLGRVKFECDTRIGVSYLKHKPWRAAAATAAAAENGSRLKP